MKAAFFQEPELEFGTGRHIDIRFGLMNYGPLDTASPLSPKQIKIGIVGTPEAIEGVYTWLEKCRVGIDAKLSKRPNLFPKFPGYGNGMKLHSDFVWENQLQRSIPQRHFDVLCKKPKSDEVIREIAQLYLNELEYLAEKQVANIFVCAYPYSLVQYLDQDNSEVASSNEEHDDGGENAHIVPSRVILHDYLKAKAMRLRTPIQVIRPGTYDDRKRSKRTNNQERKLQDEATRAWNLYTAFYYKAGGTLWRLVRDSSQLDTCYVGISFYRTLDESKLLTSTAQVFNERGEGVIVRGNAAQVSKEDKQIHLSADDAYSLLNNALSNYRREHKNFPARVVVHKSSMHSDDEVAGFAKALEAYSIEPEQADFVSLTRSYTRLFRGNIYPPLRGTFLDTGRNYFVLYTKGSVDFFSAYPGMYVPLPLGFRCDYVSSTAKSIAKEILALTKMNWNNTQFDGGEPITLRASRQVGDILKYLDSDYEPYYRYYM